MKTELTTIQILGLSLLPISMAIFFFVPHTRSTFQGAAFLNYPIATIYFLLSFADRPKNTNVFKAAQPKFNWHIVLSLMMISCFTLNKDMHLFALTPLWLKIFLPISLFAFIFSAYKGYLPNWASKLISFILGMALLLFAYYAIVLLPYTPIAFIGLILLGLSIHLVIPAVLVVAALIVSFKVKYVNTNPK